MIDVSRSQSRKVTRGVDAFFSQETPDDRLMPDDRDPCALLKKMLLKIYKLSARADRAQRESLQRSQDANQTTETILKLGAHLK